MFLLRILTTYVVLLSALAGGLWALRRSSETPPPAQPEPPRVSSLIAWSVNSGEGRSFVAVIALPPGRRATVIAIPGDTVVDLPGGGPATVGEAGDSPGSLIAAVQATFDQRIPHYVVSQAADFQNLINQAGGINVLIEEPLLWQGQTLGPGDTTLTGGATLEYLRTAGPEEVAGRWEDVLAGVLAVLDDPGVANWPFGATDDAGVVPSLLARAKGAPVVELPTSPLQDGGQQVDRRGLRSLRLTRFPGIGGKLVRVVVLNGNGQPGLGAEVSTLLAPAGFRVVSSQNLEKFDTQETQVIAATSELLPQAEEVRRLLGLGKVYVGPQPTGIADITIVMGKDYSPA
jgi:hypothetical protein